MNFARLDIPEVIVIEPAVFDDHRGFFFESYNERIFRNIVGQDISFVQDNFSRSKNHTVRGLHFQIAPYEQGKLVQVILGEIFDVAVDLRPDSPTCGQWVGQILSGENNKQLWIPPGFAHGFMALSESADVLYKVTDFYNKDAERCIVWNDPDIGIIWPDADNVILSEKDENGQRFADIKGQ
jgi:dTDP-4-dehydrorhamnose 3,5-epimerase